MATGVPGRTEYSGSQEAVWCSTNGDGLVRVEIRRSDQEAVLLTPSQAEELAGLLRELAKDAGKGFRITDRDMDEAQRPGRGPQGAPYERD